MRVYLLIISIFFLITNCVGSPGTAFLGPAITGVKSGSIYQASLSFGSNKALENLKKEFREKKIAIKNEGKKIVKLFNEKSKNPAILPAFNIYEVQISEIFEPEPLP